MSRILVTGRTKLAGERAIQAVDLPHLILRASWVYGARGSNFLLTVLRLAKELNELSIGDDQICAATWSRAIAPPATFSCTCATVNRALAMHAPRYVGCTM